LIGWDWAFLTDLAPFKPTLLPADDPSNVNYFFDTAERRSCPIAPERFYESHIDHVDTTQVVPVTEQMDIFSAGCIIAQLFLDGENLFDFSQLLSYRAKDSEHLNSCLSRISSKEAREMIYEMLKLDPQQRPSTCQQIIDKYTPSVFPPYFEWLHQMMAQQVLKKATERVQVIQEIFETCVQKLGHVAEPKPQGLTRASTIIDRKHSTTVNATAPTREDELEGMEIIATLLTSSVRSSHQYPSICVSGLALMQRIADYSTNYTRLQRLIPYTCTMLADTNGLVKATAIRTLTYVLTKITSFPASEANLFNDYILPALRMLYTDTSDMVRVTFSEHLPLLSYQAKRFLEMGQLIKQNTVNKDTMMIKGTYDTDLAFLQEQVSGIVLTLSMDDCSVVKRALLTNIVQLCMFFGRRKTNDFVLPMIITFLNSRDWRLRHAFFEQIVGISMFVGPSSLKEFILPCIMQALYDAEEFVIEQGVTGLVALTELGLFNKSSLLQIASKVAPLLHHPNTWIRTNAIACFSAIAKQLGKADTMCFLINNVLRGHLEYNIWIVTEQSLLESIKSPLSRHVYDRVITAPSMDQVKGSPEDLEKLALMKSFLEQIARAIKGYESMGMNEANTNTPSESSEVITLQVPTHVHYIPVDSPFVNQQTGHTGKSQIPRASPQVKQFTNEWNTIFNKPTPRQLMKTRSFINANGANTSLTEDDSAPLSPSLPSSNTAPPLTVTQTTSPESYPSHLHGQSHEHRGSINELAVHDSGQWFISGGNDGTVRVWDLRQADRDFSMASKSQYTTSGRILSTAILSETVMVTCANDRGWVHFFNAEMGATVLVASVSDQGAKFVQDVDTQQNTPSVNIVRPFNIHSSSPLLVCGTQTGLVCGLDPRMAREAFAWKSKDCMQQGPITSLCGDDQWMVTGTRRGYMTLWDLRFQINVCTSRVTHNSINRMAVCTTGLPQGDALAQQQYLDINSPSIYVATGSRDIRLFNLEKQATISIFRCYDRSSSSSMTSSARKKRSTTVSVRSNRNITDPYAIKELEAITWDQYNTPETLNTFEVKALHVTPDNSFYTGSTDRKLRYWNMGKIENSYVVSGLENNEKSIYEITMDQQQHQIINETIRTDTSPLAQSNRRGGVFSAPVVTHHLDTITDIKSVTNNTIVSCSRDGILKVWK
jgi:phosphoinositide-3-kinase regulatory subunit 4